MNSVRALPTEVPVTAHSPAITNHQFHGGHWHCCIGIPLVNGLPCNIILKPPLLLKADFGKLDETLINLILEQAEDKVTLVAKTVNFLS